MTLIKRKAVLLEDIAGKLSMAHLHRVMGEEMWGPRGGDTFLEEIEFLESIKYWLEHDDDTTRGETL